MNCSESYNRIHSLLSNWEQRTTAKRLREPMTEAVQLTENSLSDLIVIKELLLDECIDDDIVSMFNEATKLYAKTIERNNEDIAWLKERIAEREQRVQPHSDERGIHYSSTLEEIRNTTVSLFREQLESLEEKNESIMRNAAAAYQAIGALESGKKTLRMMRFSLLLHILCFMIYEQSRADFEKGMKEARVGIGLDWSLGQILGLIPVVGIPYELWRLAQNMRSVEEVTLDNAESILQFLDDYIGLLSLWREVADSTLKEFGRNKS